MEYQTDKQSAKTGQGLKVTDWEAIQNRLKVIFGNATYNNWFKNIQFVSADRTILTLSAPTRFIKEWVQSHYALNVLSICKEHTPTLCRVDIKVIPSATSLQTSNISSATTDNETVVTSGVDVSGQNISVFDNKDEESIGSPLDRRFTFDNFIVGPCNEFAYAAANRIAESDTIVPGCNPLYFYGGVGLGKTHLMHAIALKVKENFPHKKVAYLSAEKFMYQFVKALRNKSIVAFKDQFRSVDVLLIDDIQFIGGKENTQEEFFHTFNALMDQNKQLIISSDRPPSQLQDLNERFRSRLSWGLVADFTKTSYDLRLGILKSKLALMKDVNIPDAVLEFLATKISSNIRELEGALNKVVAHSTLMSKHITLESTQIILSDLLKSCNRSVTIDQILKQTAKYYNITLSDMASSKRSRNIARPRQVAMYLAKKHTCRSLSEIGRKFGKKDHTTVIHAVRKIEELKDKDSELNDDIFNIERILQHMQ